MLEQGWATTALQCSQLESRFGLHSTITSVLAGNSTLRALFRLAVDSAWPSTQRTSRSLTWNCCLHIDNSQSCWQKKSEPRMQLGFSWLTLMTISCSYEHPAIPIWTVAVPSVGAVPPPITSRLSGVEQPVEFHIEAALSW